MGSKINPKVLSATTLIGDKVRNLAGDDLGKIEELMVDLNTGLVEYAVLSYGATLGMGGKFFAVPWTALRVDLADHKIVIDVDKNTLDEAPGFDKSNWPEFADPRFVSTYATKSMAQQLSGTTGIRH